MIENISAGGFLPGHSYLHKLDPRTKFLVSLVLVLLVFNTHSRVLYLIFALIMIGVVSLSRLNLTFIGRGLRPFWLIILLTVALQILLIPGQPILMLKFLSISREGLYSGLRMGYNLTMAILITSLFMLTTSPVALADGLERLFAPLKWLKVPVGEIALMITIALRFIPTLLEEAEKIMKAQSSRGARFDSGNFLKRAVNYVSLLVPLIVSSLRRADELAIAMDARAFMAGARRTRMHPLKFTQQDYITLGLTFILIMAFVLIKRFL